MTHLTQQQNAIIDGDGFQCVTAVPGAGKTTTLIEKVNRWVDQGLREDNITVITFTNAAADELRSRMTTQPGYMGTLHSFLLWLLRSEHQRHFTVVTEEEQKELIREAIKDTGCKDVSIKRCLAGIHRVLSNSLPKGDNTDVVAKAYVQRMLNDWMLDFDMILYLGMRAVERMDGSDRAESGLMVDEAQDSGDIDWQIFEAFPADRKFIVGDPSQSIYGFRGAEPECMYELPNKGYTEYLMTHTFRFNGQVREQANHLIQGNAPNALIDSGPEGVESLVFKPHLADDDAEIEYLRDEVFDRYKKHLRTAIILRTNYLADRYSSRLGIQRSKGGGRVDRNLIFLRKFLTFLTNPHNNWHAIQIARAVFEDITRPPKLRARAAKEGCFVNDIWPRAARTLGRQLLDGRTAEEITHELQKIEAGFPVIRLFEDLLKDLPEGSMADDFIAMIDEMIRDEAPAGALPNPYIGTIHSVKGMEFERVFMPSFDAMPINQDIEEERRIAYVGMTRAKKELHLLGASRQEDSLYEELLP